LYFCRDLDGYGWCLPKGEYLNVGLGHRDHHAFGAEFRAFVAFLEDRHLVPDAHLLPWRGHAYLACGAGARPLLADGLLLIGDAAGLAYPTSGEGIRPAIESALIAARTLIAAGGHYNREALQPYAEAMMRQHPRVRPAAYLARALRQPLGRAAMSSPRFVKHVVLGRWFLHQEADMVLP
jgi:flavin-dependent dehydrogenase